MTKDTRQEFYKAWKFLSNHKMFRGRHELGCFDQSLEIYVEKVNPKTGEVDDNPKKNTKVEVWLECGEIMPRREWHDRDCPIYYGNTDYDCGGDTFEEAIIALAKIIKKKR